MDGREDGVSDVPRGAAAAVMCCDSSERRHKVIVVIRKAQSHQKMLSGSESIRIKFRVIILVVFRVIIEIIRDGCTGLDQQVRACLT